ncbi:flavin reductase [Micromonospora endolithica]|uniref:Flavin reductase n=1 Tax=Micromonospora endolithica TaxID=230091 RepID=A0A3A9ZL22_9ACTN|nr:flavin reductase [Micromonospora endolithica]RKN49060.1 flavin reductase [Micromonospora endolithica]TWJ23203.1 hypothetical protein JD76_03333 [Micromonospora endolithica]
MSIRRVIPHEPTRPLWRCRNCGVGWPCQSARLSLLSEYRGDRVALGVYLATQLDEAQATLAALNSGTPPADLADRFLGWLRAR